ncbi:unnamed protein product [Brassica rapa]|uniref:Pectinesterase n=1 Tax=Brassica campestris TaxID=3711 RepID=A0A8D9LWJ4_BRACM|nr:unnamed protein product [Brassica rapa]
MGYNCVSLILTILLVVITWPVVYGNDATPILQNKNRIEQWFNNNVPSLLTTRKDTLAPALLTAEATPRSIRPQNGRGDFKTLTEAINSVPVGNKERVIIKLGHGEYKEKVTIDRNKPFITLYGNPNAMPVLTFDGTAVEYGTVDSATLIVLSDYFMAINIIVKTKLKHKDSTFYCNGKLTNGGKKGIKDGKLVSGKVLFRSFYDTKPAQRHRPEEVDAWFTSHPLHAPGALHFTERNATMISYGVQTNSSSAPKRGQTEDPTFKFIVPLQIAAEREIARFLIGDPKFCWSFGFKEFAQPAVVKDVTISPLNLMGPVFFLAFSMFSFALQLGFLATEKELKLCQAMTVMGVYDTAYWLSWLIWDGILTFVSSLFLVLFGMMFQFDFFLKNSFFVIFLLFLLFHLAFMLSSFISKSSSATTVGFLVFLIVFITQTVATGGFP